MDVLLRCSGGLGRNIVFSGVVRQYHEEHPEDTIHVMASYPDAFTNLDFIEKIYPFPGPNVVMCDFFQAHRKFEILEAEPYLPIDYREKKINLLDIWCKRLNLKCPSEKRGIINLSQPEKQWAENILKQLNLGKVKLVAFQPFGGVSYYNSETALDPTRTKQIRDLPITVAQEAVDKLNVKNIFCLQISLPTEPQLKNVIRIPIPEKQVISPRFLFALMNLCDGFIGIDSFGQHAWTALSKSNGVVCWGSTSPVSLGYTVNTNLVNEKSCSTLHCNRPETFLFDMNHSGLPWQCPTGNCMKFKSDDIVKAVLENLEKGV